MTANSGVKIQNPELVDARRPILSPLPTGKGLG
jgi:hypothetical protein